MPPESLPLPQLDCDGRRAQEETPQGLSGEVVPTRNRGPQHEPWWLCESVHVVQLVLPSSVT